MLMRRNNLPVLLNDRALTNPTRFSEWLDEVMEDAFSWHTGNGTNGDSTFAPELNVYETDNTFEVNVALPGMRKQDFDVSYDNGLLTISGERKMEHDENSWKYHHIETRFGRFRRSLPLPEGVINQDKIEATYENGILNVKVPKIKEKAGRKIKVT